MTNTLSCLVDTAINIKDYFKLYSFMVHHHKDGSFVEFKVDAINDFPKLVELCDGLNVRVFAHDDTISIMLYEK